MIMAAKKTTTTKKKSLAKKIKAKVKTVAAKVRQATLPRGKMAPPLETLAKLRTIHPDAHCELVHQGPFELLVATVLSAQTTDVLVNKATPKLFERWPDARALGDAELKDVEPYVSTLGFF